MERTKLHVFYLWDSSVLDKTEEIDTPLSVKDTINIDKDFYIIDKVSRHFNYDNMKDIYLYKISKVTDDKQTEWLYELTI